MVTTTGEPALEVADPHATPTIEETPIDHSKDRTRNPDRQSTLLTTPFNTPINSNRTNDTLLDVRPIPPLPSPTSRLLPQSILLVLPAPIISAPHDHKASRPEPDLAEPSLPDPVLPRYLFLHPITLDPLFPELIPSDPPLQDIVVPERGYQVTTAFANLFAEEDEQLYLHPRSS
ncbi:uncharacterized protein B0T23DRAFT_314562 [Neurospora hispaniola]|uniref:Uncharacterized protein n=1 Tax=Neurospora hispaniola TaxID=588809 RepID=A0AAJ0MTE6_9PEZI|nr:hypothetical protein B0T23DRAFT_314562 [Neurospora hispaniola]